MCNQITFFKRKLCVFLSVCFPFPPARKWQQPGWSCETQTQKLNTRDDSRSEPAYQPGFPRDCVWQSRLPVLMLLPCSADPQPTSEMLLRQKVTMMLLKVLILKTFCYHSLASILTNTSFKLQKKGKKAFKSMYFKRIKWNLESKSQYLKSQWIKYTNEKADFRWGCENSDFMTFRRNISKLEKV